MGTRERPAMTSSQGWKLVHVPFGVTTFVLNDEKIIAGALSCFGRRCCTR